MASLTSDLLMYPHLVIFKTGDSKYTFPNEIIYAIDGVVALEIAESLFPSYGHPVWVFSGSDRKEALREFRNYLES